MWDTPEKSRLLKSTRFDFNSCMLLLYIFSLFPLLEQIYPYSQGDLLDFKDESHFFPLSLSPFCAVLEFFYLLGGESRHGNSPEDLRNLLSWPQNAQRVGEVSGGGQEQRSPQTGPGMSRNLKELFVRKSFKSLPERISGYKDGLFMVCWYFLSCRAQASWIIKKM